MWSGFIIRLALGYALFGAALRPRHGAVAETDRRLTPAPAVHCTSDFDSRGGIALYIVVVILVVMGLGVLCEGDYKHALLVLTEKLNLSDDVAGATFMAAGSSSAELFLSLIALLEPAATDDTGAGTIVGSAIFNVCITIGLSALFSPPSDNEVRWRPIARDVVYNVLAFSWVIGSFADGEILWYEAMLGVMLYGSYVVFMVYNVILMKLVERVLTRCCRRRNTAAGPAPSPLQTEQSFAQGVQPLQSEGEGSADGGGGTEMELVRDDTTVEREATVDLEQEAPSAPMMSGEHHFYVWKTVFGRPIYRHREGFWVRPVGGFEWVLAVATAPFRALFHYTLPNAENPTLPRACVWITFSLCLVYLLGFTLAMVVACQKIGCLLGMDEAVVGATLLAWGSSLPDALTSIFVARAGKGNMAVSNVLGSNVFDVLFALGVPWLILTVVSQKPVVVNGSGAVIFTGILFGSLAVFCVCMFARRMKLDKVVALVLFLFYILFLTFLLLHELEIIAF
jgi:K+-dependent Na+/Ca+ exchanger-like protein